MKIMVGKICQYNRSVKTYRFVLKVMVCEDSHLYFMSIAKVCEFERKLS